MKKNKIICFVLFTIFIVISNFSIVSAINVESNFGERIEIDDHNFYEEKSDIINYGEFSGEITDEVIIGKDNLVKINNTLRYPYSTSAYVESKFSKDIFRGSANFISYNVLITAAHNVYDRDTESYSEEVKIYPAATPNSNPVGAIKASKIYILEGYKSRDNLIARRNDLALIVLNSDIGKKMGSLRIPSNDKNYVGKFASITGYPSYIASIKQMYTDSKEITYDNGYNLYYEIDTLGGSSGSAVYDSEYNVLGVHVSGYNDGSKNIAVKLNKDNINFIRKIANDNVYLGWKKVNNDWLYYENGMIKTSAWIFYNKKWYYLQENGIMKTGWFFDKDNKWYYLQEDGAMKTGWFFDKDNKWYYLQEDGAMKTGWFFDKDNKWYYLQENGAMKTGWFFDKDNKWYYLQENGAMKTGWFFDKDNKWYYMNSSGAMQTGWLKYENNIYYLNSSGAMLIGEHYIDNKLYKFNLSGALIK